MKIARLVTVLLLTGRMLGANGGGPRVHHSGGAGQRLRESRLSACGHRCGYASRERAGRNRAKRYTSRYRDRGSAGAARIECEHQDSQLLAFSRVQ